MLHRFHDRFGTAGVVIGVIALIVALGGTAIAAGGLTKSQEKQVKKIAKKYAGKNGATGPTGPAGANGKDGTNGTNGTNGANGKSVTVAEIPVEEEECEERGGAMVAVEGGSGTEVCNGAPWTAGGTLPSGATETGAWSAISEKFAPVSFAIPLAAELPAASVHIVPAAGPIPSACDDGAAPAASAANPEADAGHLCAFVTYGTEAFAGIFKDGTIAAGEPVPGAGTTGAVILNFGAGLGTFGSFAVTAP